MLRGMAQYARLKRVKNDVSALAMRIEQALEGAVSRAEEGCPPLLARAIRYAVFPGGARLRPSFCLTVALANGDPRSNVTDLAATALELVHCASLVHDDLPCFDDADLRRGVPSVHKVFGEAMAVLVGDALIVHAFETLALASEPELVRILARATGPAGGMIAGQGWESEPSPRLDVYHRAKTASLFEAAASMGAVAADCAPESWRPFGERVGCAYQAADDLVDALKSSFASGKTTRRDREKGRPNIVDTLGVESARRCVRMYLARASEETPLCVRSGVLRSWLDTLAKRMEEA